MGRKVPKGYSFQNCCIYCFIFRPIQCIIYTVLICELNRKQWSIVSTPLHKNCLSFLRKLFLYKFTSYLDTQIQVFCTHWEPGMFWTTFPFPRSACRTTQLWIWSYDSEQLSHYTTWRHSFCHPLYLVGRRPLNSSFTILVCVPPRYS